MDILNSHYGGSTSGFSERRLAGDRTANPIYDGAALLDPPAGEPFRFRRICGSCAENIRHGIGCFRRVLGDVERDGPSRLPELEEGGLTGSNLWMKWELLFAEVARGRLKRIIARVESILGSP